MVRIDEEHGPHRRAVGLEERATTWIVLTAVLGAAVIGLGIWVIVLETGHESASSASAARMEKVEAELSQRVPELETLVHDLETQLQEEHDAASVASEEAQKQLDAAREEVERASEELGAKGEELADVPRDLRRLSRDAEAGYAKSATATARDRADAQSAHADLAEACPGAVTDALQRLYEGSDNLEDRLDEAARELNAIAGECAPAG